MKKPKEKKERKKKSRSSLQRRYFRNTLGIMLLVVIVCVIAFSITFSGYYLSNMESGMVAKAKASTGFFSNYIGQSYKEYYQSCIQFAQSFEDKNTIELQFVDTSGRVVASSFSQISSKLEMTRDLEQAISTKHMAVFVGKNPATGERVMAVSSPMIYSNGEVIGVLRYVTSLRLADRQTISFIGIIVALGALVIAVVLFSSRYFMRTILEPVRDVTATAKRIASGSYGVQIQKRQDDEIGELVESINEMSTQISLTEKLQSEFVSSVSHELRTPLTAIAGWSETLLSAEHFNQAETRRGISVILREAKRLTEMVEELLEFTRVQDGRLTLNVAPCDLRAEFEDTVFMYASRLKQEGITLNYVENDDEIPPVACDSARLRQVWLNILDNAAKHGGAGKKINAEICRDGAEAVVRIRDFGPGIPEEELPLVKRKFYKGSSTVRGSGIGLAVCDEIVSMHGGTLTLANAAGGGTLVTVRLPLAEG